MSGETRQTAAKKQSSVEQEVTSERVHQARRRQRKTSSGVEGRQGETGEDRGERRSLLPGFKVCVMHNSPQRGPDVDIFTQSDHESRQVAHVP